VAEGLSVSEVGKELTSMLSDEFGDGIDVTLIDKAEGFIFGFSKYARRGNRDNERFRPA
jgi:hypothetical protein